MPLTELQIKATELIAGDPEAMKVMQQQVHRLDPGGKVIPKQALTDILLDEKISSAVDPIRRQNEELKAALEKKTQADFYHSQREFMKREYKMTDAGVDDLVKWMEEGADGNLFKSYEAAHRYRMAMSTPTHPNGTPTPQQKISAFTRRPIGSEPWREAFKDPKHPLRQSKAEAKEFARAEWKKADDEWQGRR
jgi:hypothetical protein